MLFRAQIFNQNQKHVRAKVVQLLKKLYVESNPGKMLKEHIFRGLRINSIFGSFLPIDKE
jgi:hypothetical protein